MLEIHPSISRPSKHQPAHSQQPPFIHLFLLGIRTVISEWIWLIIQGLRRFEQKQIQTRLNYEFLLLAQLEQTPTLKTDNASENIDLCQRQIQFLNIELTRLRAELDKTRQEYIAKRCEAWGLILRP